MIAKAAKERLAQGSQIRKMFEEGKRLASLYGAENVYDFSLGNPDQEPPAEILAKLRQTAAGTAKGTHGYMQNAGYPEARAKVAAYESSRSGVELKAENVIMTVGAAGALNVLLKSLCDPEDEVIIIAPYFTEYTQYIHNAGAKVVVADSDADFLPNFKSLEAAITPNTKAIIVNSPNNPSGTVYPARVYQDLQTLLSRQAQTIYVISDEPYREIVYDDVEVPAIMQYIEEAIVVYSWSKSYSLAGERIGYVYVNPLSSDAEALCQALTFYNRTLGFVNAPAIWQRVVTELLDIPIDVTPYKRRRDRLWQILQENGFECLQPAGAFYLFMPVPPGISEADFVAKAAEQRILLVGATGFGKPGYVRLSYAVPDQMIERSAAAFKKLSESLAQ